MLMECISGLLLITFFLQFFPELIKKGHLYILQTPLFRVRNKKKTMYCYSEQERDQAVKVLGATPEITRFKGLGEISPDEFKNFIGEDIRLDSVILNKNESVADMLEFYMGRKIHPTVRISLSRTFMLKKMNFNMVNPPNEGDD